MRVLVVGSGGREHALVWKLLKSPTLTKLFVWPGNDATWRLAEKLELPKDSSYENLAAKCLDLAVDLVVVGPEEPLSKGIADALTKSGVKVFGPLQSASQLESSKSFAKCMMEEAGIPTAKFTVCHSETETLQTAQKILERDGGVVLKASGLAAGKGVFVCTQASEVSEGIRRLYSKEMMFASKEVVVEEMLFGRECSYFCFLGKSGIQRIGFAVDHKRLLAGDKGPNTGGMGCYSPVPWLPIDAAEQIETKVVEPLLQTLARHKIEYTGVLYVGVMWSDRGPSVVEFNVRFGDPEVQVLALSDSSDWLTSMALQSGVTSSDLKASKMENSVSLKNNKIKDVVGFVLASSGYPFGEKPDIDAVIPQDLLLEDVGKSMVFQASVKPSEKGVMTGAGRVFLVAGSGDTFSEARDLALSRIREIQKVWPESQWRADIGQSAVNFELTSGLKKDSLLTAKLILGSSSPRRRELLGHLGLQFEVIKPETDEIPKLGEAPRDYVSRNAKEKCQWICENLDSDNRVPSIVVCADTIVVIDGMILEKPSSDEDALRMLRALSGQYHEVLTAVEIAKIEDKSGIIKRKSLLVSTRVKIRSLSRDEMLGYISTKEPFDKAGGYAAQGLGSFMVERIEGSFSNVVGLPLAEVSSVLSEEFGIQLWRDLKTKGL
ncbi:MAG: phosphoribosylamine--glycine ligase [Proteobacteria bacterium]|nr:phosphoribosylamine--glycine ligase [Pseudomonadota bacterium]